jgi:hypothetical protein
MAQNFTLVAMAVGPLEGLKKSVKSEKRSPLLNSTLDAPTPSLSPGAGTPKFSVSTNGKRCYLVLARIRSTLARVAAEGKGHQSGRVL